MRRGKGSMGLGLYLWHGFFHPAQAWEGTSPGLCSRVESHAGVDSRVVTPECHPGAQKGKIW